MYALFLFHAKVLTSQLLPELFKLADWRPAIAEALFPNVATGVVCLVSVTLKFAPAYRTNIIIILITKMPSIMPIIIISWTIIPTVHPMGDKVVHWVEMATTNAF